MSSTQTQYLTFDAPSIKQLIIDRLNEVGAFTDQNYEGSNISSLIEIFAYVYQSLLFYNNRTSTNNLFSDTNIYENINRLVKLIDYKPIGFQTATLTFAASALNTLIPGGYIIPRYTFFRLGSVMYSFNTDITFTKTTSATEFLNDMSNQNLLYQGKYVEYPLYTAMGTENEILTLVPGDDIIVDHFNIDVYVQDVNSGTWTQWKTVPTLFLENKDSKVVEMRLNSNKRYEIKFGNNINGKQLNTGDVVAVYYLQSTGSDGEVGIGAIDGKVATVYNTIQFNDILSDVYTEGISLMDSNNITKIQFTNNAISTKFNDNENVESIRTNAPKVFRSQYRLVTLDDYEAFVRANFSNIIQDIKLTNNWGYLSEYIKYLHDIGLTTPNKDSRVFFNQLMFADACNFNNIYGFVVPRIEKYVDSIRVNYLTPAQKEIIINKVNTQKTTTAEFILLDPVYIAITVGMADTGTKANILDKDVSYISVVPEDNSNIDITYVQGQIRNIIKNYFATNNSNFGQVIDVGYINNQILNIDGIKKIYTRRIGSSSYTDGLSLLVWNPVYPAGDIQEITKNQVLEGFKFPFFYDIDSVINNIVVEGSSINEVQSAEY